MSEMQMMAPSNMTMPMTNAINGSASGAGQSPKTSLYVGNLDTNITDAQVFEMFSAVGQVSSVRVCRDVTTLRSLGYAFVNFSNASDAARAIELLNFIPLGKKSIRIMYLIRDPGQRLSGVDKIFVKNLDKSIDNNLLRETFSAFGNVVTCKVATDSSGQSKGYGFVQYETEEAANKAIAHLNNGTLLFDKHVFVVTNSHI